MYTQGVMAAVQVQEGVPSLFPLFQGEGKEEGAQLIAVAN